MCAVTVPTVDVFTKIYIKKESITLDVIWQFDPEFTPALAIYDTNRDKTFQKSEMDDIKQSIEEYVEPINYLINLEYIKKGSPFTQDFMQKDKLNYARLTFDKNNALQYKFSIDFKLQVSKDHKMFLEYFDPEANFNFIIKDITIHNYDQFKTVLYQDTHSEIYFFKKQIQLDSNPQKPSIQNDPEPTQELQKESKSIEVDKGVVDYLSKLLEDIKETLKLNLQDIKENSSYTSYLWLLIFSFLYGVVHALGPGHGKSLVGSYFLGEDRSHMKALTIASLIGVVHTFSAFILTLVVYFVIGSLLSSFIVDVEQMAIKVSAFIIILIALYLLYKKITVQKPSSTHVDSVSCGCSGCKTKGTDIGVILAAGIVPCPGTVTVFIFTMGLGVYFVGFLSALFMSIGMSLVIYITALLSIKVRKSTSSNSVVQKIFEYGSIIFILILGTLLLVI
jgi:ABC-type nickel/cobalt efflux system permease component RcnA